MRATDLPSILAALKDAVKGLEPPFLALPERGKTVESLAYQRGARDAYLAVIDALEELPQ